MGTSKAEVFTYTREIGPVFSGTRFSANAAGAWNPSPEVVDVDNLFFVPGEPIVGIQSKRISSEPYRFMFYQDTGALLTRTDAVPPVFHLRAPTVASNFQMAFDGATTASDGSGFVICPASNGACYLFSRSCETDADCAISSPGAVCNRTATPYYCYLPGAARDDRARVTTGSSANSIYVLANDTVSDQACLDPTLSIQSVQGATAQGGTATISGDHVLYTPPADFCGKNDTFTYTAILGKKTATPPATGLVPITDQATVTVFVTCVCGNGKIELGEECDGGAGCGTDCLLIPVCGNKVKESGEQCDDGNLQGGDGCTPACTWEPFCGNGIVDSGEQCDDSNKNSGDGCSSLCVLERCGDGSTQVGVGEQCDDGNTSSGDGCSNTCLLETRCGDSKKEGVEECDDGNATSGDGCRSNCTIERCGDAIVDVLIGEQCDDGNSVDADGCTNACVRQPICPNGLVETGEQCDDNNKVSGDGCSATCQAEALCGDGKKAATEECDDGQLVDGDGCSSTCKIERCGDGITQTARGEQCDDGNLAWGDSCHPDCRLPACGDGTLDVGEECDDGNTIATDSCTALCKRNVGCGNGILDGAEQCDDGNTIPTDGCDQCMHVGRCGDGVRSSTEECDDANTADNDGCSSICKIERCGDGAVQTSATRTEQCDDGNSLYGDGCRPNCTREVCGDGTLDAARGEECDDGNSNDVDSCSNLCKRNVACGNGVLDGNEECDDGNLVINDGCN
ncbi:MAG TPA: DUF4215 domain-containing protein, partial [Polyangiaceae bacterium]|nr:DUF4215 domain-containing protein [Polyangiaceae bacterium]